MLNEYLKELGIDRLLTSSVGQKLQEAVKVISEIQQGLYNLEDTNDSKFDLLKIGTVFQVFFIDILASGRKPGDLSEDDWKDLTQKVYKYAVLEDRQSYSEFVFTLYANYIDISVEVLSGRISESHFVSIKAISDTIWHNTELLRNEELSETQYIEACLWLSLEAMMKLMSSSLTIYTGNGYAELVQAVTQLAFEYGRYVLWRKEQIVLDRYVQNQYILDEQLKNDYQEYLEQVEEQAGRFQKLITDAFSIDLHNALIQSVALARETGVDENDILESVEEINAFFVD